MTDSELRALISLLEDEDPEVKEHVQEKLISLGHEVVPTLETFWENQENQLIQEAIEEIIYTIQSESAILEMAKWFRSSKPSLFEGWYLLTTFQYPELEKDAFRSQISRLINRIWLEIRSGMTTLDKVLLINRMIFTKERYRSNRKNLSEPQNFFLNGFMDTRKGAPISLGIFYLILCRELEIPMYGIILPGYFVLVCDDGGHQVFIDVFNKGSLFGKEELDRFIQEMNVEHEEKYYLPASNQLIILELMRTLVIAYQQRKALDKAEEMQRLLDRLKDEEEEE